MTPENCSVVHIFVFSFEIKLQARNKKKDKEQLNLSSQNKTISRNIPVFNPTAQILLTPSLRLGSLRHRIPSQCPQHRYRRRTLNMSKFSSFLTLINTKVFFITYISAESKKLIPELKALSRRRNDSSTEFCSPKVMVPVKPTKLHKYCK